MSDLLRDILTSPFGSFSFIFGLLVLSGWLIFFITKKVTEIKTEHGELSKTLLNTESRWEKTLENIETQWEKKFDRIDEKFDKINEVLAFLTLNLTPAKQAKKGLSQSRSPISLTDEGIKVSKELDAEGMIARNWDKIYADLEKNVPDKNAYDIQEYCMKMAVVYPERILEKADIDKLKLRAFNEGDILGYYAPVFALPIRDKYLKIKGIDIGDVDKHDPNKNQQ
jgi:hypothetical protein